ncbi:MAG: hypothetical protein K9M57_09860, partial [Phycisphaerae bacterium]|nr:hypothetical protein [Phycisphaerae bacterium]
KKISSIEIPVESRQSDFLSYTTAQTFENFGQASRMRKNQQGPPLLASLFNCQPLRKTSISRYEEPAVKLFEDITGVQNDQAAYTVRILAVDKQRDPVSLDDDGRQGSAAIDPMTDNSSTVKEQVTTDWKNLKAYQMACEQAEAFAELAADDFDAAIEKTNASLKSDDPNDPVLKLQEGDLEKDRTQMESLVNRVAELRQQIRDYPNLANYISGTMNQSQQMIAQYNQQFNEAMKRAQELKAAPSKRPLLKRPQAFACRVFENLTVTPPYQEDYNRRKAIVAQSLQHQFQDLYIVIHYNPENIEKRMKYDDIVREKADDEAKNE